MLPTEMSDRSPPFARGEITTTRYPPTGGNTTKNRWFSWADNVGQIMSSGLSGAGILLRFTGLEGIVHQRNGRHARGVERDLALLRQRIGRQHGRQRLLHLHKD